MLQSGLHLFEGLKTKSVKVIFGRTVIMFSLWTTWTDNMEVIVGIPDLFLCLCHVCKVLDITPKFCPTDQCGLSLEVLASCCYASYREQVSACFCSVKFSAYCVGWLLVNGAILPLFFPWLQMGYCASLNITYSPVQNCFSSAEFLIQPPWWVAHTVNADFVGLCASTWA